MTFETVSLGPVEAQGLTSKVEEAELLAESSPADAVLLYEEVERKLRERFPRHAERFREKRAFALIDAVGPEAGHDALMELAVRDLFDRSEPKLSPEVARGLGKLRDLVDPARRQRGEALFHFRWTQEDPKELFELAKCLDALAPDDEYAPHIAVLLAEVAAATRNSDIVKDRQSQLQRTADLADGDLALRLRVAFADADGALSWSTMIADAQALRLRPREGTHVCMRAARWSAWKGEIEQAESLYRLAMRYGADAGLDLDVKNALRSLLSLYGPLHRYDDFVEAHQLMLAVDGSDSFIPLNAQSARYSYQNLATGELPEAHLQTRYRVLEGVRSGCLSDEIEAHDALARVYLESSEPMDALEHAVLGGDQELTKEAASQIDAWPEFLQALVGAGAPWVRLAALHAIEHLGDLAPPEVATTLAHDLIKDIISDPDDPTTTRALYEALSAVVLEATDKDIDELMPAMARAVDREPDGYRWTDPGVVSVAASLYRFRPSWRERAAEILAERLLGAKTNDWWQATGDYGPETNALVEVIERVADRTSVSLDEALANLGHLSESTRDLWSERLEYVAEHPTGPMRSQKIGDDFEVPRVFLVEQSPVTIVRYVSKLVALANSLHVHSANRARALRAGGNVVDMLPEEQRLSLFREVEPLVAPDVKLSENERHEADTDHPLSRVRIRMGGADGLRLAAGWFLARVAISEEQRAIVISLAKAWLWSLERQFQNRGAIMLSQPNLAGHGLRGAELAKHPNAMVRRMALLMPDVVKTPDLQLTRDLATDPSLIVRLSVIDVLPSFDPEVRDQLLSILAEDRSALVRHATANAMAGD
ncbi:MAG: hypothetical protein OXH19_00070 [Chloroflexi bacterium]|nr:hypothetical protein [Chloroflexota bacterium]MCY3587943.1 hypothetical protein [Chloroflexota bacterium]MCY3686950.1 hypothetical protein [Chloroflexota bacterium]MDE2709182.1 hypothetical protein [Chloroflexota bacterium]